MFIIHTEKYSDNIIIPVKEWNVILEKLKNVEDIKIEPKENENFKQLKGKGVFKMYSNVELIKREKKVWEETAVIKFENS
ncbi:hypothetical protein [Haliovirga abyssi]|uniref:Uncharacterized protein n=1 Tax=Haliovirga abyssi TaxID=2996794 RepID=A0AAU9DCF8_9FUSO|nr:hypothetical protein [Haliovirga abyssi]BDU50995.1 hypothetical protein HLVA_15640 [Haliovirga abyssi]